MNFDTNTLRKHLTDELYNQYCMQLDTLKVKNQQNIMSDFSLQDSMITNVESENNQVTVEMELIVKFYDYIQQDGKVVRGSNTRKITMHYNLTFVANFNNHLTNCPNCGAELDNSASQTCEYCRTIISGVSSNWVLSKKEARGQK